MDTICTITVLTSTIILCPNNIQSTVPITETEKNFNQKEKIILMGPTKVIEIGISLNCLIENNIVNMCNITFMLCPLCSYHDKRDKKTG